MKPGKVYIKRVAGKPFLQLAWIDPTTGRERRRSAETNRSRDADKLATAVEKTLYRGVPVDGISWLDFCARYKSEHLATLKEKSRTDWPTAQDSITAIIVPATLRCITPSAISEWSAKLREQGKTKGAISRYLRTLRTALRWAERIRLIHEAPYISIPRRGRKKKRLMKGRPITLEEFERMIKVVPKAIPHMFKKQARPADKEAVVASWRHTLWVYYLSGIRLDEATELYWDRPDKLCIQGIDRKHPMMLIQEELEKGNEDRLYPLTPDFVEYLRKTPPEERHGRVCKPLTTWGVCDSATSISRAVSAIGKAARVVVNNSPTKYASAHDLRRSFGTRWAPLVPATMLQQLMRHKSLSTTMDYYVELHANETSATLQSVWKARKTTLGDPLGDPQPFSSDSALEQDNVS